MAAIISGNDLGLSNSSLFVLGARGAFGRAEHGRNNEGVFVDVSSGNLVLQTRDELVIGRGIDIAATHTYNQQGTVNNGAGRNWQFAFFKQVTGLTGTVNTAGSTVTRMEGDGAASLFTYDVARGLYVGSEGDGAHDTLSFSAAAMQWTFINGTTRESELYSAANGGRITAARDADLNVTTFTYNAGGQLTRVQTAGGDRTFLDYVGGNVSQLRTINAAGQTLTRTRYTYDGTGRLTQVRTDLSPENNSVADGNLYAVNYTYDGASNRVATMTQTDGTSVTFAYVNVGGAFRVATMTDALGHATSFSYNLVAGTTTVTDALGFQTVYAYDAQGQLTSVTAPNGQVSSFVYDASGNVTQATDGEGHAVVMQYDANGNLTLQRDAAGNTVTRTYNANNQLLTETLYVVPDPDGPGAGLPSSPNTTRYAYDGESHLRFIITQEGRVTEHRYNTPGQRITTIVYAGNLYNTAPLAPTAAPTLTQMQNWVNLAATNKALTQRSDLTYDFRGQVSTVTTYTAVSATGAGILDGNQAVTTYVYDQAGLLVQTISPLTQTTAYAYDGLGRVLSMTDALGQVTLTDYDDAGNSTTVTMANGLATISLYDAAGRLISVAQADAAAMGLGETQFFYDAANRLRMTEDPTGARSYMLYDGSGRKVADIDSDGSLTEYVYNDDDRVVRTISYATAADVGLLVDGSGNPAAVTLAAVRPAGTAQDQKTWTIYDSAERLVKTVDAAGFVVETVYDGSNRVTDVIRYATAINTALLPADPLPTDVAPASAADDRRSRNFYDRDGLLRGVLDAEGFLVEHLYNPAGEMVEKIGYANATPVAFRLTGTLAQLIPASSPSDIHSYRLYNLRGQLAGIVGGDGLLTETVYDRNGNVTSVINYATRVTYTAGATLASLRPAATAEDEVTTYTYTALNQRQSETSAEGTLTEYVYDNAGNLVSTTRAVSTAEVRTVTARYDIQGRVTGELSGEGSAMLTGSETQEELDAIFAELGTTHTYDAAGRRTSSTDPNGNRTRFFYDTDGHLTHTVNALGEVTERRYNALNQVSGTTRYGTRIDPEGLDGGLVTPALTAALDAISDPALDSSTTITYNTTGTLQSSADALGDLTTHGYNAFKEETARSEQIGPGSSLDHTYSYDKRGLLVQTVWDPAGVAATSGTQYDAFGRAIQTTDANGNVRTQTYDRAGRVLTMTDPLSNTHVTTYDALGRVLTQTDALGAATSYAYDTAARSVTVTSAEGISVSTSRNRHGQTQTITDGRGNSTTYSYDRNGNLIQTLDALGQLTINIYDEGNRLIETVDANGNSVAYTFDAANRVLSRQVDAAGLNLTTSYAYSARGETIEVTDANGTVTQLEFNLKGERTRQTVDPGGLALETTFTYDGRGKVLTVVDPRGVETEYVYDALGRRTEERVDPAGLNLVRTYAYDDNGNAVTSTDPNGNVSRHVYDANDRLVYTVDPAGGVVQNDYDAEGRITRTVSYSAAISLAGLPAAPTAAQVEALIVATPATDRVARRVLDQDGRQIYTVDGNGAVVQSVYDENGNVVQRTAYAQAISTSTPATEAAVAAALAPDAARDRVTSFAYDAANRQVFSVDAAGIVTRTHYDAVGRVVAQVVHANPLGIPMPATEGEIDAALVADTELDRVTRTVFDAAGRIAYSVDALGAVMQQVHDGNGNVVEIRSFANPIDLTVLPLQAGVADVDGQLTPDVAQDRVIRQVYDADNRVAFRIDSLGFVQAMQYDGAGNVVQSVRYANAVPPGTPATPAGVAAALTPDATADQVNSFVYDAGGRLVQSTDGLGFGESFTYDGLGNKLTFTNKNGDVCHYAYDAAGRLATKTEGPVEMTTVVQNPNGSFSVTTALASQVTQLQYDALGQVISRTEAAGRPEQRTTTYAYDAAGRQIRITFPPVNVYDAAGDNLDLNGATGAGSRVETLETLTVEVTYNAFGEAVVNRDVGGNYSYKVYDGRGLVRYEVDAEHNLTAYERDAFGGATEVIRYATALDFGSLDPADALAGTDVEAMLALQTSADHEGDRAIITTYDGLGRAVEVVEPQAFTYDSSAASGSEYFQAGKTTRSTYNAFGELVQLQTLRNALTDSWILTRTAFYDQRGKLGAEIDALGNLTTMAYDAAGNLTQRVEHAQAVSSWSTSGHAAPVASLDDRETLYAYDRNNRRVSETRVNIEFSGAANGTSARGDVTTTYGYDAVGNLTRTTDALGNSVYTYYDALGRVTAVVAPQRANEIDGTSILPLSVFKLDAHGNVMQRIDYALGAASANENGFILAGANAADRASYNLYDSHGHAIQSTDANGASRYVSYDSSGRVAKQWQPLTTIGGAVHNAYKVFGYDKLGRQTSVIEPASVTNLNGELQPGYAPVTQASLGWGISSGNTGLSVSYSSFEGLGGGEVRVDLDYVDAVFTHDESGNVISVEPGTAASTSQVFRSAGAMSGVSMTPPGGITSVDRVRLYKKQANGDWALIADRTSSGIYGNQLKLAAPAEAGVSAEFRYRAAGTSDPWSGLAAWQFQTGFLVDVSALATGNYDFEVLYRRQAETEVWARRTGTISTSTGAGGSVTAGSVELGEGSRFSRETQYNAFGEVVARGINGGFQEYFDYDNAGRLWRTNTGDGADKVAFYDLQGNATADIRSQSVDLTTPAIDSADDVNGLSGTMRTTTRFDAAGRAVQQVKPFFVDAASGGTITPTVNQSLDRWGNVVSTSDPRSALWITQYRYNASNQLIERTDPDGNGQITAASPHSLFYYDAVGQKVAERDANGNVNGFRYDGAGDLIEELHADGGHVRFGFNAFGEQAKMVDAMGNATAYARDFVGNLLQATRAAVNVYANDGAASFLGTLALSETYVYDEAGRRLSSANGAGETTTYEYDVRGNLLRMTMPMGQRQRMAYDFTDGKIAELNAASDITTWANSYFGQTLAHTDMGGATYTYAYDGLNNLTAQTNSRGQNQAYTFDQAGQLTGIDDLAINQQTTFAYDAMGQRIRERTVQNGTVYQDNHLAYDTLGRLADVNDGRYHLTFTYDKVGNRIRETVNYTNNSGTARNLDYWYSYDSMNRQTVVDGVNNAGTIGISASQGHQLTYDLNGNRTSDHFFQTEQVTGYDESGTPIVGVPPGFVTRNYTYDAHNRLATGTQDTMVLDRRHYDAAGRAVRTGPDAGQSGIAEQINGSAQIEVSQFDANGRLIAQDVEKRSGADKYELAFTYDEVGNELSHTLSTHTNNPYTNTYTATYAKFDGAYKQTEMKGTSTLLQPGSIAQAYDANGHLVSITDATDAAANRTFVNDVMGKALRKVQGSATQHYLIVDGNQMGTSGADGALESFTNSYSTADLTDTPAKTPESYTVQAGDTLQSIAQAVWGDSSLWYLIADANGTDNASLRVGQRITVPTRVNGAHNNYQVFKPYDPAKVIGDVTPNLPVPPSGGGGDDGCGGFGFIIVIIVTIVVAYFAPYLLGVVAELGTVTFASVVVGAVAGNIAGQLVGNAIGIQDGFDWKAVAVAAVTAGITYGLGQAIPALQGTGPANVALRAAVNTAVNQGVRVLAGMQDKFDWRSVAASAIGAGVGAVVGNAIGEAQYGEDFQKLSQSQPWKLGDDFSNTLVRQFGSGLAANVASAAVKGGKLDLAQLAGDAFGNALGQALVSYIAAPYQEERAMRLEAEARARAAALEAQARQRAAMDQAIAAAGGMDDPTALIPAQGPALPPEQARAMLAFLAFSQQLGARYASSFADEEGEGLAAGLRTLEYVPGRDDGEIIKVWQIGQHVNTMRTELAGLLSPADIAVAERAQRYIDQFSIFTMSGPFQDSPASFMHAMAGAVPDPNDRRWNLEGTTGPENIDMTVRRAGQLTMDLLRGETGEWPFANYRPGQTLSADDAWRLSYAWVRANFQLAQEAMASGTPEGRNIALQHFGYVVHTLQDSTSPVHHGFQAWNNPSVGEMWAHRQAENFDPGPGSNMYRATRDAYDWFFVDRALPTGDPFSRYNADQRPAPAPVPRNNPFGVPRGPRLIPI